MQRGIARAAGPVRELLADQSEVEFKVTPVALAQALVEQVFNYPTMRVGDDRLVVSIAENLVPDVVRLLAERGVAIYSVSERRNRLEQLYLDVTDREHIEPVVVAERSEVQP